MKRTYVVLAVLAIAFILGGCVKITAPVSTSTNDATSGNTNTQSTGAAANLKQCDETINYQVLIDALPKEVNGYVAGEPQGNMLTFTDPSSQKVMKYSTATVSLMKEDKSIEVSATDTCYIQYLSMAWASYYEMEGTSGFLKKTTISGYPSWHQFDKSSDTYSYNVFVKERVIVSVQGNNGVTDTDVGAATNAIGFASIAAAAK